EELTKKFSIERISKAPSVFDVEKLKWINSKYINEMSDEEYYNFVHSFVEEDLNEFGEDQKKVLLNLYKKQLAYGAQIKELIVDFIQPPVLTEESKAFMNESGVYNTVKVFKSQLEAMSDWNVENIKEAINNTKDLAEVKGKMLFMPIRICATHLMHGPDLAETVWLFGKEAVLKNIEKILNFEN
ncbi:MAG: glutamate--tRNA ligase, partial [Bacilli bacterium]